VRLLVVEAGRDAGRPAGLLVLEDRLGFLAIVGATSSQHTISAARVVVFVVVVRERIVVVGSVLYTIIIES